MCPDLLTIPGDWPLSPGYRNLVERRRDGDLSQNMVRFCALLRERGLRVGIAEAVDALRILPHLDIEDWREFYLVLRTLFVCRYEELTVFDANFHMFWTGWGGIEHKSLQLFDKPPEQARALPNPKAVREKQGAAELEDGDGDTHGDVPMALYSPEEILVGRLFGRIDEDELRDMQAGVKRLGRWIATKPGRRTRIAPKGHLVDLRRSMRRSLGFGGEILALARKRRRLRRLRLVLLLDVSRSMDVYSQLLLKLIYSLHSLRGRTESFVFGTDLKRVTPSFRSSNINTALGNLSHQVPFWSGGTRIGHAFRLFNRKYSDKVLTNRTVLIVLSDGLDTDASDLVADEMALMRQKVARLIWLNPLADTPGYEPLAGSMAAALPYIDVFTSLDQLLLGRKDAALRTA